MLKNTYVLESQLQFIPLAIIASLFLGVNESVLIRAFYFATIILSSVIVICIPVAGENGPIVFLPAFNLIGGITYVFFIFGMIGNMLTLLSDYDFSATFFIASAIVLCTVLISIYFPTLLLIRVHENKRRGINRDR